MLEDDGLTIEVLWKTDHAIAVNKPAGIATQSPAAFPSVERDLRKQLDREDDYLAFPHRLDRCVSGVLLVALTKRAARLLSGQFATRKTAKRYIAVVDGRCDVAGEWNDYLRKIDGHPRVEVCDSDAIGAKLATTHAEVVSTLAGCDRLQLSPTTGRMHQLRVQCAHRGLPIIGDTLYRGPPLNDDDELPPTAERIRLHASSLGFHDPQSGRRLEVTATCPF